MDMVLKHKVSYHQRLFILLLCYSWVLVACFVIFQYQREKQFKADKLDAKLQLYNKQLSDMISDGIRPSELLAVSKPPYSDLRISIIGLDGRMVYDNTLDTLPSSNHSDRPEIAKALKYGTGYTVRRRSSSTDGIYFYSAMKGNGMIIRSAVPYTISLREILSADKGFLWFMLGITSLLSVMGYFATRKLGHTIQRLNLFARKAEHGERIYADESFPHDELGEISNNIVRLYARLQQMTENLDREHNRTLHEEQEKIRIKKQLTNNINHELKTPVASIKACLETILAHDELPAEKRKEFLERCRLNSERLCNLLTDVSTITRMDEGSMQINKEHVMLDGIINETVKDAGERLRETGIAVHVDVPQHLSMHGNYSLLSSVFRNLIDNSIAYSGGKNIWIKVVNNSKKSCMLTFADDGVGVDDLQLKHLFERFYRVDKGRSRKLGGTGLGLAIVKNAVCIHDGSISVANRYGGGLEFTFNLSKGDVPA